MTDSPAPARQRSAAGIQVRLGLMTLPVDAVPIRRSGISKTGFSQRCPECEVPTRVQQVYTCENKHGPFPQSELGRGREVDDKFVAVTDQEYADAMGANTPKGEWVLGVYPAEAVDLLTRPDESAYRLRPASKGHSAMLYGVLKSIASDARYALVGELTIKGGNKPYRLGVWQDMLVAQSLVRPDDLGVVEGAEAEVPDAKVAKMVETLLEGELADFDATTFLNLRTERIEALDEAKRNGEVTVAEVKPKVAAPAEADVLSMLEASLKKAKATRKPRAKKTVMRKAS